MTFGSLFAGIGGFDLGFERLGMQCRWQFETNSQARMILKRHFQTILLGDVREDLRLKLETVDIIYRTIIVRTNSYAITGQNRTRDFIIGCAEKTRIRQFIKLCQQQSSNRIDTKKYNQAEGYPCLTTHRYRYDARDGYIWDGSGKMRVADKDERTTLAGFPPGWLDGLSESAAARLTGNAIVPQIAEWIGERIMEIDIYDKDND